MLMAISLLQIEAISIKKWPTWLPHTNAKSFCLLLAWASHLSILTLPLHTYTKWAHNQRKLTVGGSITVHLVTSFTSLDSSASLHPNNNISSFLVKSSHDKVETSCTLIEPPTVNVLWHNLHIPTYTFLYQGVHNQYLGRCGHTTYRYLQCFSTVDAEKIFFRKILNFFQFYFRKEEEKQEAVKQSPVPVQNKK